MDNLRKYN